MNNREEYKHNFKPPAIPLVCVDPYFSIWSESDELYGDYTRHWTGRTNPMIAGVYIDKRFHIIMGMEYPNPRDMRRRCAHIEQKSLRVFPLHTEYVFENEVVRVELSFLTPLLTDKINIMSRPVSYIEYNIEIIDGAEHEIEFVYGISAECCVNGYKSQITFGRTGVSMFCGNTVQNPLCETGDNVCIDWGYLHIAGCNAKAVKPERFPVLGGKLLYSEIDEDGVYNAFGDNVYMLTTSKETNGVITLAYDSIKAVEYFGEQLDEAYKKYFDSFEEMLESSVREYADIKEQCMQFEKEFIALAGEFGEKYEYITSLAFRQAVAAHKIAYDTNGNILFLSKECDSNGCIGTLDVSYPSMPLFLKYNPELVMGMLRPIIKYAKSDLWKHPFTPHDVGRYPIANGQVYGTDEENPEDFHMPVEECGNMLICLAAIKKRINIDDFLEENKEVLKQWADYLKEVGYNPGNQLCTDDFGGHLSHNCNLGLKSIIGIAAYGQMFDDEKYISSAKEMAKSWSDESANDEATMLAFGIKNSWSLKYNLVWDKLLDLNLFDEAIYEKEIKLYLKKFNQYGVPLDNRKGYTKLDWLIWTTVLTNDKEYFDKVMDSVCDFLCNTSDRVPMSDWYNTETGRQCMFQNRSVVGGIFINLLQIESGKAKDYE